MKCFEVSQVLGQKVQYYYVEVELHAFLNYGLGKEPLIIQGQQSSSQILLRGPLAITEVIFLFLV